MGEQGCHNWLCAICGDKYDWKQPNRLSVVQTGESVYKARSSERVRYLRAFAEI